MQRLWTQTPEVPHHVGVLQVSLRISLLGMDEGWKLGVHKYTHTMNIQGRKQSKKSGSGIPSLSHQKCIPDEEDRRVIARQVPIALIGVEFHRKASRVSDRISRSGLTS